MCIEKTFSLLREQRPFEKSYVSVKLCPRRAVESDGKVMSLGHKLKYWRKIKLDLMVLERKVRVHCDPYPTVAETFRSGSKADCPMEQLAELWL